MLADGPKSRERPVACLGGPWSTPAATGLGLPKLGSVPDLDGHRPRRARRRPRTRHRDGLSPHGRHAIGAGGNAHAHRRRRRRHREVSPPVRAAALAAGERARPHQSRRPPLAVEGGPALPPGVQRPPAPAPPPPPAPPARPPAGAPPPPRPPPRAPAPPA